MAQRQGRQNRQQDNARCGRDGTAHCGGGVRVAGRIAMREEGVATKDSGASRSGQGAFVEKVPALLALPALVVHVLLLFHSYCNKLNIRF